MECFVAYSLSASDSGPTDHWSARVRRSTGNRDHYREELRRDLHRRGSSCEEGPPYTVTTTSNLIVHETIFADGRVHATFTQTGTALGVPLNDPSLPTYTAKFTVWGGFNANGKTVNGTFTFNVHGTLSDGSTFSNHVNDHFNVRPDGTVNEFFHCH
jgi:hypothetical protein